MLVTQKLGALKPIGWLDPAVMEGIVTALFPSHPERVAITLDSVGEISLFTSRDLEKGVSSMRKEKATGPDGIPSEVFEVVHQHCQHLLLNM